jgi:hypothetical protein
MNKIINLVLLTAFTLSPVTAYDTYNINTGSYNYNSRVDLIQTSPTTTQVNVTGFNHPIGMQGTLRGDSGLLYDYGAGSLRYVDVRDNQVNLYGTINESW